MVEFSIYLLNHCQTLKKMVNLNLESILCYYWQTIMNFTEHQGLRVKTLKVPIPDKMKKLT